VPLFAPFSLELFFSTSPLLSVAPQQLDSPPTFPFFPTVLNSSLSPRRLPGGVPKFIPPTSAAAPQTRHCFFQFCLTVYGLFLRGHQSQGDFAFPPTSLQVCQAIFFSEESLQTSLLEIAESPVVGFRAGSSWRTAAAKSVSSSLLSTHPETVFVPPFLYPRSQ